MLVTVTVEVEGRETGCHTVPLSNPQPPTELLPRTVRSVPVRAPITDEFREEFDVEFDVEEVEEEVEVVVLVFNEGKLFEPQAPPPPIKNK